MDIAQDFVIHAQEYAKARSKREVLSWEAFLKSFRQHHQAKGACLAIMQHFPLQIEGILAAQTLRDLCKKSELFSMEIYHQVLETLAYLLPTHGDPGSCLRSTPILIHPVVSQLSIALSILIVQRLLNECKGQSPSGYLSTYARLLELLVQDAMRFQFAPWIVLEVFSVLPELKSLRLPGVIGKGGMGGVLLKGGMEGVVGYVSQLLATASLPLATPTATPNPPIGLYLGGLRCLCAWASLIGEVLEDGHVAVLLPLLTNYTSLFEHIIREVIGGRNTWGGMEGLLDEGGSISLLLGGVGEAFRSACQAAEEVGEASEKVMVTLVFEGGRLFNSVKELVQYTVLAHSSLVSPVLSVCLTLLSPLLEGGESLVRVMASSPSNPSPSPMLPLLSPVLELLEGLVQARRGSLSDFSVFLALGGALLPLWEEVARKVGREGVELWGRALGAALALSQFHPPLLDWQGAEGHGGDGLGYAEEMAEFRAALRDFARQGFVSSPISVISPLLDKFRGEYEQYNQQHGGEGCSRGETWSPLEATLHVLSSVAREGVSHLPGPSLRPLFFALSNESLCYHRPLARMSVLVMGEMLSPLLLAAPVGHSSHTVGVEDMKDLVACWVRGLAGALAHCEDASCNGDGLFQLPPGPLPAPNLASLLSVAPLLPFRAKQDHLASVGLVKLLPDLIVGGNGWAASPLTFLQTRVGSSRGLGEEVTARCLPLLCQEWGRILTLELGEDRGEKKASFMSWKSFSMLLGGWVGVMAVTHLYAGPGEEGEGGGGLPLWQLLGSAAVAIQGGALLRSSRPHNASLEEAMKRVYDDIRPVCPFALPPSPLMHLVEAYVSCGPVPKGPSLSLPLSLFLECVEALAEAWRLGGGGVRSSGIGAYIRGFSQALASWVAERAGQGWEKEEVALVGSLFPALCKLALLEGQGLREVSSIFLSLVASLAPSLREGVLAHSLGVFEQVRRSGEHADFLLPLLRLLLDTLHCPALHQGQEKDSGKGRFRGRLDRGLERPKGSDDVHGAGAVSLVHAFTDLATQGAWEGLGLEGGLLVAGCLPQLAAALGDDPLGGKKLLEVCMILLPLDLQQWGGEKAGDFWSLSMPMPLSGLAAAPLIEAYTTSGALHNILSVLLVLLHTPLMSAVREGVMRGLVRAGLWGGRPVFVLLSELIQRDGKVGDGERGAELARKLFNAAVAGEWKKYRGVLKTLV